MLLIDVFIRLMPIVPDHDMDFLIARFAAGAGIVICILLAIKGIRLIGSSD